jgi:hypothetical protein
MEKQGIINFLHKVFVHTSVRGQEVKVNANPQTNNIMKSIPRLSHAPTKELNQLQMKTKRSTKAHV